MNTKFIKSLNLRKLFEKKCNCQKIEFGKINIFSNCFWTAGVIFDEVVRRGGKYATDYSVNIIEEGEPGKMVNFFHPIRFEPYGNSTVGLVTMRSECSIFVWMFPDAGTNLIMLSEICRDTIGEAIRGLQVFYFTNCRELITGLVNVAGRQKMGGEVRCFNLYCGLDNVAQVKVHDYDMLKSWIHTGKDDPREWDNFTQDSQDVFPTRLLQGDDSEWYRISCSINGKHFVFPRGTTLLEAVKLAGGKNVVAVSPNSSTTYSSETPQKLGAFMKKRYPYEYIYHGQEIRYKTAHDKNCPKATGTTISIG